MQKPSIAIDGTVTRSVSEQTATNQTLVEKELLSRRLAYKHTTIRTGESFFDDSDMRSEYALVVIYDKRSHAPLLSARYYFDKTVIGDYLQGDKTNAGIENDSGIALETSGEQEFFLADRLSGNTSSALYRRYRNYIFLMLYLEFLKNKNCKLILMARKERQEKLLTKYLRLGFHVTGCTVLRGKPHWVILGDLPKMRKLVKTEIVFNLFLMIKLQTSK